MVGVGDGDPRSDAVDWAAAEAAARGVPLRIVHAWPQLVVADGWGMVTAFEDPACIRWAENVVRTASARARAVAPDVAVVGRVLRGSPAEVLVRQTRDAALLVLGGRDPHGDAHRLGRSLHARVSARAECPVAIVRRRPRSDAGGSRPRVVVGVDAAGAVGSAVAFAFRAAEQRGVGLTAVHVWIPDVTTLPGGLHAGGRTAEERARRVLDDVLDHGSRRCPTVTAEGSLVSGDPVGELLAAASGSSLLVVGCRRRGRLRRAVFGSVGCAVARLATCPVAVVGADRAARETLPRRGAGSEPGDVRQRHQERRQE